jgi:hypothetical protein
MDGPSESVRPLCVFAGSALPELVSRIVPERGGPYGSSIGNDSLARGAFVGAQRKKKNRPMRASQNLGFLICMGGRGFSVFYIKI